ncbi:MAG TPA: hypothetical protein PLW35_09020, partial [Verrucomicrobiota bacterium]|nr:hypothetical protein [Verrucomicrobiota bacterium]
LTLKGHRAAINSVAFSPDGRRIVTGSGESTAKVWDTGTGREVLALSGHTYAISAVAFSPDGLRIVTGGVDATVRVWEAATATRAAAWRAEEQAATEQHVAMHRGQTPVLQTGTYRSHGPDIGAIRQWLVLAPIPYVARSGAAALTQEQIPREARLHPRAGEAVTVGGDKLVWTEVQLSDALLDFHRLLGAPHNTNVAYAVCYLHAQAPQTGLLLKVACMSVARIYLNGNEIHRHAPNRGPVPEPDVVTGVTLDAGLNVLVLKVAVELGPSWEGAVWLTDADGQPVPGLRVTLDPEDG